MTTQESRQPAALSPRGPQNRLWLLACVLLALVQVQWAGYQLGVGNQSIQVAFLQRFHDATLFARDQMVNQTIARYPSLFFNTLAQLLGVIDFEHLYLVLHLLTVIAVFVAVTALARGMFGSHWAGLVLGMFLLAGHHHALAEQALYSNGFTHTWAAFPVMIGVLALWYAERHWWAFALTGALANAHALEAGQLGLALAVWALGSIRQLGVRKVIGLLAVMGTLALPAAVMMLRSHQSFDGQWLELMHVRSALHSFPSAWWRAGNPDVPRFAIVMALAALAVSLDPGKRNLRKTLLLTGAVAAMFVAGYLFTELWPNATVIRAQLFRSSRFLMIILLAYIAWGCARSWRLACLHSADCPRWRGALEAASATLTAVALVVETARVLLPVALLIAVVVALINRRLLWQQALLAAIALLITLVAWRQIQFVVPGLSAEFTWRSVASWAGPGLAAGMLLLASAAIWFLAARPLRPFHANCVALAGSAAAIWLAALIGPRLMQAPKVDAAWFDVQRWAGAHTPKDALFLTPAQAGGFRMLSGRAVVGEWRDGTQLYFSAAYAKPWWERMNALQPGMRLAPDKRRLLVRGKSLSQLDDQAVLALARQFEATHVVLPVDETRRLTTLYANDEWAVYLPKLALTTPPAEALLAKQATFLETVAGPNIEKHRKSDVRLHITGADGRPVYDASYRLTQVNSAFRFGVTLPAEALADTNRLARVRELFNYTVLREPVRWSSLEPAEGNRSLVAVNETIETLRSRGLAIEWSALTAGPPDWVEALDVTNRPARVLAHADDLLGRYAQQVAYWQFSDQGVLLETATNVVGLLRAKHPAAKVGLSEAGRFWSPYDGPRRTADLCRGLEDVRRLGSTFDFISLHGHQPWGTWAEAATIYEVFDAYDLPVHVTGFGVPAEGAIEGAVRRGEWDAALQAEYCRLFYTIAFSHPRVAALNYRELGPVTHVPGIGLLGPDGKPRPAYHALRELILKQWRTRLKSKLPLDGRVAFRGFHGDYELVLTLKGGQTLRTTFTVPPGAPTQLRLECDPSAGKLTVVP